MRLSFVDGRDCIPLLTDADWVVPIEVAFFQHSAFLGDPYGGKFVSTILVVEDDPRIQKALHRQFSTEGYTVHVTGDGAEGLAACKTIRPSAVVLDLMLPGMTGRDVCKGIKSWSPNTPVVVLSAVSEVADKVLLAAAIALIVSPINWIPNFIPILGQLFHSHSKNLTSSELLVVVTPTIVDPLGIPTAVPLLPKPVVPALDPNRFDQHFPGANKVPGTATPIVQR